jgi:hypothetical protein
MKTPRVEDFDPDAKIPSLKSSMDHMPAIGKRKPNPIQKETTQIHPVNQPSQNRTNRSTSRTSSDEKPRREIKPRHPFDIYQDQLDLLKELSLKAKIRGELGSMSAMVREALDDYLNDKKNK